MSNASETLKTRWRDVANLVLGAWLLASPWVLADAPVPAAAWNAHATGVLLVIAALLALFAFAEWEEWLDLLFAVWLVASPWLLGYAVAGTLVWSSLAVGMAVGLMALWSLYDIHGEGVHA